METHMLSRAAHAPGKKPKLWRVGCLAGILIAGALLALGYLWFQNNVFGPREAPEAEAVLSAQSTLPFQLLIPAFLPAGFDRAGVMIQTDQPGPNGEAMARLVYSHPLGVTLTLSEWIPAAPEAAGGGFFASMAGGALPCQCACARRGVCSAGRLMVDVDALRIMGETSDPQLLTRQDVQAILQTLGPAAGLQVYSTWEEAPVDDTLPPAVQAPVGADGVQEVALVVSPDGYSPAHFAVKRDLPVRLVFRQLGQVGCGNELFIEWGPGQPGRLFLSSPADKQVLEFTPHQPGDFPFYCPHKIYQGVMTVQE